MQLLIDGCRQNDRESQRLLYQHYYGYAMSICIRYCKTKDEAKEIINDGFMKVFSKITQHDSELSFKAWLRSVMVHSAIDYYRKEVKHYHHEDVQDISIMDSTQHDGIDALSYIELVEMIQHLSPAYRAVFNLYVIDGYTHLEISKLLNISEGTSKSNLMKARNVLRKMIEKVNLPHYTQLYVR
jgi:RNA polymerase sigma-70 factor (ECF subfamily)